MQAAILNGLSRTRKVVDQQGTVQCPTGICAWDQFQTLGVCNRCQDLTSDLKRIDNFGEVYNALYSDGSGDVYQKKNGTAFTLPNGHFLMNMNDCSLTGDNCYYFSPTIGHTSPTQLMMSSFGTGDPNKTNSMLDINTLIWSMSIIHLDIAKINNSTKREEVTKWPERPLLATECAVYYCVKTIDSTMEGNIIRENVNEATDAVRDPNSFLLTSWNETTWRQRIYHRSTSLDRWSLMSFTHTFPGMPSSCISRITPTNPRTQSPILQSGHSVIICRICSPQILQRGPA